MYLVIEGGWNPDGSWDYDPMLAIENAEIGGTLIALSIPGLRPLVDREFSKLSGLYRNHRTNIDFPSPSIIFASDASKNTVVLSGKDLRPNHSS